MNKQNPIHPSTTLEFTDTCNIQPDLGQWCIAIVEQGNGSYFYQDVIYEFQHRDCFLLYADAQISASYGQGKPCRISIYSFSMEDLDLHDAAESSRHLLKQFFNTAMPFQQFSLPRKNYDNMRSYLKICNQIYHDTLPVSPMIYRHTFLAFLLYFAQTGFVLRPEKAQESKDFSSREIMIAQVKHLIRQNYAEALPLTYIADYVFTNPSYLSRTFKAETGVCLSAFINQVRIGNAKLLLEDTDELIIDIAVACGFNQVPHFNRIFKEIAGMSPSAYRKTYRHRT